MTNNGRKQTRLTPLLSTGLRYFNSHNPRVHQSAYASGTILWIAIYWISIRLASPPAQTAIEQAATAAAGITGLYFGVLYTQAIGSPIGNLGAASAITLAMPLFVYRWLAPASLSELNQTVLFLEDGNGILALLAGVISPLLIVLFWYGMHSNIKNWEHQTMPNEFSLLSFFSPPQERGPLHIRYATFLKQLITRGIPILLGLVIIATTLLFLLPDQLGINPEDVSGTILVLFFLLYRRATAN